MGSSCDPVNAFSSESPRREGRNHENRSLLIDASDLVVTEQPSIGRVELFATKIAIPPGSDR